MAHQRALHSLILLLAGLLLAACGGGGGGSDSNPLEPKPDITLHADATSLPVQTGEFQYPYAQPYTTNVWAEVKHDNGGPLPTETVVNFSVRGGQTETGALYPSDLSETVELPDGTEVPQAFWSWPVESSGGIARLIFHAWQQTGSVTIRAEVTDPSNGRTATDEITIQVGSGLNDGNPDTIFAELRNRVYTAGSGHDDTGLLAVTLRDAAGQVVTDPESDNLRVELLGDPAAELRVGGESGQSVETSTVRGEANVSLVAEERAEEVQIRLISDRDNDVTNGIDDPVTDTITVGISDGTVQAITLTGPYIEAIRANGVDQPFVLPLAEGEAFQDGTYSRVISAVATDRFGNPPPAGTEIRFSLVDSPLDGYPQTTGTFAIQGGDGNALEGGNEFSSASARFQSDGVRREDALVINADPEGQNHAFIGRYTIESILGENSLFVDPAFPWNDGSGSVEDTGASIPYVVGRAQYGNVFNAATTNAQGVASTAINYPVSRLNQRALLVASADGTEITSDVFYAPIRPLTLTSSHTELAANSTTNVTLCLRDLNDAPVSGREVTHSTSGTGAATVTVNGGAPVVTGGDGCVTFPVAVSGQITGEEPIALTFTASGGEGIEESSVEITVKAIDQGRLLGQASQSGGTFTVNLELVDDSGNPVSGDPLSMEATANGDKAGVTSSNWLTGPRTSVDGEAQARFETVGCADSSFTFTFEASGGATFSAVGTLSSDIGVSDCEDEEDTDSTDDGSDFSPPDSDAT
ncbi:hypothetical protein [Arhodomonas sp. SL1]|uniref:hypothetical protein n=1 Tax=Arhodomonas sp. SL1 TaxID=3425691 RepID=UPI003F885577